jgi:hypothetical protein
MAKLSIIMSAVVLDVVYILAVEAAVAEHYLIEIITALPREIATQYS